MKFSKLLGSSALFVGTALALMACADVTVKEPSACDMESASFEAPAVPAIPSQFQNVASCAMYSVSVPSVSTTTTVDLSDSISKLSSVASNLNVTITELSIDNSQGLFNWVQGVDVQVSGNGLPMTELANYTMASDGGTQMGSTINVNVVISASDALKYLSSGPVTLTITLEGGTLTACDAATLAATNGQLSTSVTMCASASGKVTKSL